MPVRCIGRRRHAHLLRAERATVARTHAQQLQDPDGFVATRPLMAQVEQATVATASKRGSLHSGQGDRWASMAAEPCRDAGVDMQRVPPQYTVASRRWSVGGRADALTSRFVHQVHRTNEVGRGRAKPLSKGRPPRRYPDRRRRGLLPCAEVIGAKAAGPRSIMLTQRSTRRAD